MSPRDHTNCFGVGNFPVSSPENPFLAKLPFFGPRGRFFDPGTEFWTPGQIWGFSGRHSGPGTFLDDFGVPKNILLRGNHFSGEDTGESPTPK